MDTSSWAGELSLLTATGMYQRCGGDRPFRLLIVSDSPRETSQLGGRNSITSTRKANKCPVVWVAQYVVITRRKLRRNCTWKIESYMCLEGRHPLSKPCQKPLKELVKSMKNSPCCPWSQSWDKTECASFTLLWLGITPVLMQSWCRKRLAVGVGTNWPAPWPAHDTYDGEAQCLATADKAST